MRKVNPIHVSRNGGFSFVGKGTGRALQRRAIDGTETSGGATFPSPATGAIFTFGRRGVGRSHGSDRVHASSASGDTFQFLLLGFDASSPTDGGAYDAIRRTSERRRRRGSAGIEQYGAGSNNAAVEGGGSAYGGEGGGSGTETGVESFVVTSLDA